MRVWKFDQNGCSVVDQPDWEALLADTAHVVWVDLKNADAETIPLLRDTFKFHPLAIEDTLNERQRPKVEEYENHLFGILNGVDFVENALHFREIDVFVGSNFIVTIHDTDEPLVDSAVKRVDKHGPYKLPMTSGYLLYLLVDVMVDSYFPVMDAIGDHIEELSEKILDRPKQAYLAGLFRLKRALGEMWRVVGQQRDMFLLLTRETAPFVSGDSLRYYLRDVYDHLLRIADTVNTFRENLSNVIDLYLSAVSNRLNVVVKRLTVYTILFGALAVISGFYGMNFTHTFPPFEAAWGVPFVIALMAIVAVLLVRLLDRNEE
ncbi:MAG: magnesium/cobalt transporter CorA [Anaerolineae bacterium]